MATQDMEAGDGAPSPTSFTVEPPSTSSTLGNGLLRLRLVENAQGAVAPGPGRLAAVPCPTSYEVSIQPHATIFTSRTSAGSPGCRSRALRERHAEA